MKLFLVLCLLLFQNCKTNTTYDVSGVILEINKDDHKLLIDHNEIPGFMNSMVMYFNIHNSVNLNDFDLLDSVIFNLVVTEDSHYSLNLNKVGKRTINNSNDIDTNNANQEDELYKLKTIGEQLDDFTLIKTNNEIFNLSQLKTNFNIITFIFSRCPMPEMCPATISNIQYLAETFENKKDMSFILISFDYIYDTPEKLYETYKHIEQTYNNIDFLSSVNHINDLYMVTKQCGVSFGGIEENNIGHTMRTVVIDANRKILKIYEGFDWKPGDVKADLLNLMKFDT